MVMHASRRCRRPCLARLRHATRYGWLGQHPNVPRRRYRIELLPHSTCNNLRHLFSLLRLHSLKLSPYKSRIGAARVDFLGYVISQDGGRSNDDKIAALSQIPMPRDIKQLRSLLGGLSYYRKFLPSIAKRVRSITFVLKRSYFQFHSPYGSGRSRPTRGTRSPINTCLSRLGRCYRQVSIIPPVL